MSLENCNFCAKKYKKISRICESTFISDDQTIIIEDLLKIFPNDVIELFTFNPICSICGECLKQLQNCYIFVQQIKEAAMRLTFSVVVKKEVGSEIEVNNEMNGDNEAMIGTAFNVKGAVCGSPAACTMNLYNSCPAYKPILPKTSAMNTSLREPANIPSTSSASSTSRLYKCLECAETFKSFKHLRHHETGYCTNTNISGVYLCKYCHLCFKEVKTMTNHISRTHSEQQFLCCLCKDKTFTSKGYLTRHINKIHDHPFLQYFCGECKDLLILPSQDDVKSHFSDIHPLEDGRYNSTNEKSQESLNEEDMDLEMHEEFLDEFLLAHTNENSFQFSECWDALDLHLPDMLQAHSTSFHNSEELSEAFPCPKCFEQFSNPQPLLKHLAENHNLPVLICRRCRKAFASLNNFKMHKVNRCVSNPSQEILTIPCPYCSKTFNSTLNLKQHLRIVHTQHKKHICQLCDKQYSTLDHLKKHVLSQHQNERKHICQICTKSFTQLCHLKQHLAIHTTGKPIQCMECPERFWRNVDMQRHRTKQHGGA